MSPLECANLLAILRVAADAVELMDGFALITPQEAEEWTMTTPPAFVATLAAIPEDRIAAVASDFAAATQAELGWSAEDFEPVVKALSALARRAQETDRAMYLWNSL
jgi:hypothetical protein